MRLLDNLLHKYLRIPYRLHVHVDQRPKKSRATIVLLHGMGNSGATWDAVVKKLPDDLRVISIDLLGFGESPSPRWLKYSTDIQAKAVMSTLLRLGFKRQLIIVGHSMGSLVAVEIAKRYPMFVKSLVLCSPPLYNESQKKTLLPDPNLVLKNFYRLVQKYPKNIVDIAPLATKLKIVGKAFNVTAENVDIYMGALEASIVSQTGFKDVKRIQKPVQLLHGAFDPVVVKKNLDAIVEANPRVTLQVVLAGHELLGAYIPAVVKAVQRAADTVKRT